MWDLSPPNHTNIPKMDDARTTLTRVGVGWAGTTGDGHALLCAHLSCPLHSPAGCSPTIPVMAADLRAASPAVLCMEGARPGHPGSVLAPELKLLQVLQALTRSPGVPLGPGGPSLPVRP